MIRRGFNELVTRKVGVDELADKAARNEGVFGDHLRRILVMPGKDEELCAAVRGMLAGEPCPDFATFYRLRSAGVLRGGISTGGGTALQDLYDLSQEASGMINCRSIFPLSACIHEKE